MTETVGFTESLVARAPVVFFRRTADLRVISYVSVNASEILGFTPAELVDRPGAWDARIHDEDRRWYLRGLADVGRGARTEAEYRWLRPDGTPVWLHCIEYPERDESGALEGTLGYATDVTERMTVLAVLRGAHAEMQALNDDLKKARDAAETANRAKSEFLSGMSHEIRTPLNAILGFAQLLGMAGLAEEEREGVEEILKGGRHLLSLVDEVLDIARIEAGNLSLSLEPVQLAGVIEECVALVWPLAMTNDVTLLATVFDGGRSVLADRQRVKQVLLNLLSNAIKYNRAKGTVGLHVSGSGEDVVVSVRDTGMGIARDKMDALFKPFDRLGAERTHIEGTGLGLALSRRLVEAMEGKLTVSSRPGEGSDFSMHLKSADMPELAVAPAQPEGRGEVEFAKLPERTVIYVEDNLSNLKLVEHILERRPRVKLHAALQGRMGLDLIRQHHPQLVLLDLNLADIDGAQVLENLMEDPHTAGIPVVVISADASERRVQELLEAGARAYLTKPLDVGRCLAVLDSLLWPPRETPESILGSK